ncbi:MAG: prepilin-type N-terminal cleavage/methylation domain-containing protein [Gemmatimonadetes bacterium]|nr:prepilin-type N-terminal cleavage/methylation domain-containing protein [Gemmatimonadota bacterium]
MFTLPSYSRGPRRVVPSRRGFTIIELITTLSLITVMTSVMAPQINLNRFRLNSALNEVASVVIASKSKAILRQHDVILVFDEAESEFRILLDENNSATADDGESFRTVQLHEGARFGLGGAPTFSSGSAPITFAKRFGGLPRLSFHRNGSASEEGVIYLTSARAENGGFPEDARAIAVDRATGQVRCMSYSSLVWKRGC